VLLSKHALLRGKLEAALRASKLSRYTALADDCKSPARPLIHQSRPQSLVVILSLSLISNPLVPGNRVFQ
jgi:hypothetical protein